MNPFKSISDFSDEEIAPFMEKYFPKHRWFHADPEGRIKTRRNIENWLHSNFISSGGKPKTNHPCYFTLEKSSFLQEFESFEGQSKEIKIPLCLFSCDNISFTYPDSFFSEWLSRNKDHDLYDEELNGKIFKLKELLSLLDSGRIPNNIYMDTLNYKYHLYIEAQVWDYSILTNFQKSNKQLHLTQKIVGQKTANTLLCK